MVGSSIVGQYFRNAIVNGMPAVSIPDIVQRVRPSDREFSLADGRSINRSGKGSAFSGPVQAIWDAV